MVIREEHIQDVKDSMKNYVLTTNTFAIEEDANLIRDNFSTVSDDKAMTEKEIVEKYFNDEKIKEQLDELALHFYEISRGNWTTVEKLNKKSFLKNKHKGDQVKAIAEVKMFVDLLVMSKRAFSKNKGGSLIYKITLNNDSRKILIKNQIREYKDAIIQLEKELH